MNVLFGPDIRQVTDVSCCNVQEHLSCNRPERVTRRSGLPWSSDAERPSAGCSNLPLRKPMAPIRAAEVHADPVRPTMGPAAAAEAHGQGRTAICAWPAFAAAKP
jgi:hypothetical protein